MTMLPNPLAKRVYRCEFGYQSRFTLGGEVDGGAGLEGVRVGVWEVRFAVRYFKPVRVKPARVPRS